MELRMLLAASAVLLQLAAGAPAPDVIDAARPHSVELSATQLAIRDAPARASSVGSVPTGGEIWTGFFGFAGICGPTGLVTADLFAARYLIASGKWLVSSTAMGQAQFGPTQWTYNGIKMATDGVGRRGWMFYSPAGVSGTVLTQFSFPTGPSGAPILYGSCLLPYNTTTGPGLGDLPEYDPAVSTTGPYYTYGSQDDYKLTIWKVRVPRNAPLPISSLPTCTVSMGTKFRTMAIGLGNIEGTDSSGTAVFVDLSVDPTQTIVTAFVYARASGAYLYNATYMCVDATSGEQTACPPVNYYWGGAIVQGSAALVASTFAPYVVNTNWEAVLGPPSTSDFDAKTGAAIPRVLVASRDTGTGVPSRFSPGLWSRNSPFLNWPVTAQLIGPVSIPSINFCFPAGYSVPIQQLSVVFGNTSSVSEWDLPGLACPYDPTSNWACMIPAIGWPGALTWPN